jgi:hypothetical protein
MYDIVNVPLRLSEASILLNDVIDKTVENVNVA